MEDLYTAYTKKIDGEAFHFVKHYQTFPEYRNVSPLLENYGMHTDFVKACKIAKIRDKVVQKQLFETVKDTNVGAEIIQMNRRRGVAYNHRSWQLNFPLILSWMGVRKLLHLKQRIA